MKNWSTVVAITNLRKTHLYLQQKDGEYWIPQYRFKYCFFGGRVEKKEDDRSALQRELLEEFEEINANYIFQNSKKLFDSYFINVHREFWKVSLYESILGNDSLMNLSYVQVKEGKGVLVKKEDILQIPFFPDIKKSVLDKYLYNFIF